MDRAGFVRVGRVVKTHGCAGEVSVKVTAGLPVERLEGLTVWFVPPPAAVRSARVTAVRPGPKGPLVSFEGIDDVNLASALRGTELLASGVDLPEVEDEFDAVGVTVTDEVHGPLGEIVDVIETGANDVWVVEGPFGQVLIPVIDEVTDGIDVETRSASVRLLPGLLPDE